MKMLSWPPHTLSQKHVNRGTASVRLASFAMAIGVAEKFELSPPRV